jgi:hypothetical protein
MFWDLTPRLWASSCRCFEGSYRHHLQGQDSPRTYCLTLKAKAGRSFEISGIILPTTRLHAHKAWMFSCTIRPFKLARLMGLGLVSVTLFGLVERRAFFYQAAWHVLSVTGTPRHGACFGFGWRRRKVAANIMNNR